MTTVTCARSEVLGPPVPFEPVRIGPIWDRHPDGRFVLPENSLGWGLIAFAAAYLRGPRGGGWTFTVEQARLLLWFYAVDREGNWIYSESVIQMVKGWGKDPFGAVLCALELIGPVRFSHWEDREGNRLEEWAPGAIAIGKALEYEPWIQVLGVAREQTKNTMNFLSGLFSKRAVSEFGIEVNKLVIYATKIPGAKIEAITSAWRTIEGNRPSFVIRGEPHHWITANDGHDLNAVIRRNVNKMSGEKGSRTVALTNAYNPGDDSVLQREREAYEVAVANGTSTTLWYSLEAPEDVGLFPEYTRLDAAGNRVIDYDEHDQMIPPDVDTIIVHLSQILGELRGDAVWLTAKSTVREIMRPEADLAEMRRFYLNSIVSGDEVYVTDADLLATIHPDLKAARSSNEAGDVLRLGWSIVGPHEPIVLFFDGSKSDDATALVGCRVSDGYTFLVGLWQKPRGERGRTWLAPKDQVKARVIEADETFKIVAFWADPSHTKDDAEGTRYWDVIIDEFHERFKERIQKNLWAVQTGERVSAIMWDMASPAHSTIFSEAVVRFSDDVDAGTFSWDGHPGLRDHLRNARRSWGRYGMVVRKPSRGGSRKIDAAVCAIGARMLARLVKIKGLEDTGPKAGNVWYRGRRGRHG